MRAPCPDPYPILALTPIKMEVPCLTTNSELDLTSRAQPLTHAIHPQGKAHMVAMNSCGPGRVIDPPWPPVA